MAVYDKRPSRSFPNAQVAGPKATASLPAVPVMQHQAIHATTQLSAGRWIVDDGQALSGDQISKAGFLSLLRDKVQTAAKDVLEPVGLAQANCPDLSYWISYYTDQDSTYLEKAISRYAPDTSEATNPESYLTILVNSIRAKMVSQVENGNNQTDPEPPPASLDEARPHPDIFKVARGEAPVQLSGCMTSSTASKNADQAKSSVSPPLTGKLVPSERKEEVLKKSDAEIILRLKPKVMELRALYHTKDYDGFADAILSGLSKYVRDGYNDPEEKPKFIKDVMANCSGVASLLSTAVFGEDIDGRVPDERKAKISLLEIIGDAPGDALPGEKTRISGAFTTSLDEFEDSYFYIKAVGNHIQSHHFTIIKAASKFDLYEGDETPGPIKKINILADRNTQGQKGESRADMSIDDLKNGIAEMLFRSKIPYDTPLAYTRRAM